MANNNNDLTVNIKATFDKSNMGDFKSEVTKAVEDAAKSVKAIEIKANTQSARDSMQKFTSYLSRLNNAKESAVHIKNLPYNPCFFLVDNILLIYYVIPKGWNTAQKLSLFSQEFL